MMLLKIPIFLITCTLIGKFITLACNQMMLKKFQYFLLPWIIVIAHTCNYSYSAFLMRIPVKTQKVQNWKSDFGLDSSNGVMLVVLFIIHTI